MSENNPPADAGTVDDAPLSITEGVENLTSLLADPETDLQGQDQDQEKDETEETEAEGEEPEAEETEER